MIPSGSIDLVLTDPPYGTTACKWDSVIPVEPMWSNILRLAKAHAPIVFTAAQPFSSTLVVSQLELFKYEWVWEKTAATGHLNAKHQPLRAHESVLVFCRGRCKYVPQKTLGHKPVNKYTKRTGDGDCYGATRIGISGGGSTERYPRSVQVFPSDKQRSALHPTQKPLALMEYLIATYTSPGDTVLDFSMGSGTTGVACKRLARNFVGIEINSEYFEIAKSRIADTEAHPPNTVLDGPVRHQQN
jgi:site-specific DNA-methyltransferase (adenine-specific)